MFYLEKRVNNRQSVSAGSYIGKMTNMAAEYSCRMTNHIHVRLFENEQTVDPTDYVC